MTLGMKGLQKSEELPSRATNSKMSIANAATMEEALCCAFEPNWLPTGRKSVSGIVYRLH